MEEELNQGNFSRQVVAGAPLIYITTDNESRTEFLITRAALHGIKGMPVPVEWSCVDGFPGQQGTEDPLTALRWAVAQEGRGIFIFKDMHWFWADNPFLQRTLKDFAAVRRPAGKTLVFIGAEAEIPPPLREDFLILDHGLPNREEIRTWLQEKQEKDVFLRDLLLPEGSSDRLTAAAQGLDLIDIERALRLARVTRGAGLDEVVTQPAPEQKTDPGQKRDHGVCRERSPPRPGRRHGNAQELDGKT